jgi:hypothetical protein
MRAGVITTLVALATLVGCTSGDDPVVLSTSTVSANASGGSTGSVLYPSPGDHLHIAFGIYVCDQYLPPLVDRFRDVSGIHTHADGVIHVHPFSAQYSGQNATLEVFGDIVDLELDEGGVTLPDGTVLPDDVQCNGVPAELQLYDSVAGQPTQLVRWAGHPGSMPLNVDRNAIVIAAVAPGTVVPPPPGVPTLDELSDVPAPPTTR